MNATTQYEHLSQASFCCGVGMAAHRVHGSRFSPYEKALVGTEIRLKHEAPLPLMKRESLLSLPDIHLVCALRSASDGP